ncbi:hypothetical protein BU25DRAFT_182882 [Macroventuria anomochaeta]|uniref:Uncharacterized protein n=1 Tax=Macroventuria anomochaeta TaxID=301207 RepID=A0ACB6RN04_9PLEO|nr:uncharacterized protein BU25DRAFT_182882 [Macroventuria anomochaeta]KAF2623102.1 hypothetical protein BU25DRAFT_182882 [Macroventuria anomochaeta]
MESLHTIIDPLSTYTTSTSHRQPSGSAGHIARPVQTMMLPYLDVADIVSLSRTCKGFGQLQPVLKVTAYNINDHLKKFFKDPLKFQVVRFHCGALVHGDFARKLLLPCPWKDKGFTTCSRR